MRVSLIQMAVSFGRPQENFARVLQLLNQAVQEEPDVIVLPEMWNTGYALSDLAQLSDKEGQKTQELLSQFVREHKVALVAGSVAVQEAGQFFNRTYVYGKDGQLLSSYDKVHLFGLMAEDQYLTAGQQESHFELAGVKASNVICYDIRFPEWLRTLMADGAQILFVVAEWPQARMEQWEILLKARAVENQTFVVAVNRVGDDPDNHFNGHSLIINPLGQVILQASDDQEGIFTADLDLTQVDQTRGHIPVFDDRKPELYHWGGRYEIWRIAIIEGPAQAIFC